MKEQFARTKRLIGEEALERLAASRVAVFGLGGVGGYVCEALVRSGVGHFDLIDNDTVDLTNLNRQIIALHSTIGRPKTEVMKERMLDINPDADITVHNIFFLPENSFAFPIADCDYIVDAVDTVTAKIELVMKAKEAGVPIISSMGTGNKLDPGKLKIADLYKTNVCPLAKVMRRELKKRGIDRLKVVYSEEMPVSPVEESAPVPTEDAFKRNASAEHAGETQEKAAEAGEDLAGKTEAELRKAKAVPGSTAFVPAAAGLMIAAEVIRDLMGKAGQ